MSAGSGPMAGLVLGWESGTQRGWGRARASLALLTAARSNIRCRILMEIAAPIQRKQTKRNQLLLLLLAAGAVHLLTRYFLHPHMLRSQRGSCSRTTLSPHPSLSCGNA
ncbi:hypothetical protein ACKVV1_004731 [Pyricularia oryzae]